MELIRDALEGLPIKLLQDGVNWQLTLGDGTVEFYDADGRLTSSTTQDGKSTNYLYQDGNLKRVTGPYGHTLNLTYADGFLSGVLGPDGTVNYSYDDHGNLKKVTYPDGTAKTYLYDDFYHISSITGIIDELDKRIATWEYDTEGRVTMNERAGGLERHDFTYNDDGTTTVEDGLGATRVYNFKVVNGTLRYTQINGDRCDKCGNANDKRRIFNVNGHIESHTDWNETTTSYLRDDTGLELSRTEAVGTPQERIITTEWHTDFRKPIRITEPDRVTEYSYDSAGRLTSKTERALP